MGSKTDVWQGTLALMVLKTLETLGPMHGYGIARRIEQTSGDALALNYGTLYPALPKLEQGNSVRLFCCFSLQLKAKELATCGTNEAKNAGSQQNERGRFRSSSRRVIGNDHRDIGVIMNTYGKKIEITISG
jgi:Transcriptional regulator PadR-like family